MVDYAIPCKCCGVSERDNKFRKDRSHIPFEYLDVTKESFNWEFYGREIDVVKNICNAFIIKFEEWQKMGKGIYLYSKTTGSGKTFLACICVNEIAKRYGGSIRFTTIHDYIELIKEEFKSERGEVKESRAVINARLLIIDDIGNTQRKEWTDENVYKLIDYRNANKLVTIYTSNVKPENLNLDDRIRSRILNNSIFVQMPEKSIRAKLANQKNEEFLEHILKLPLTNGH